MEGLVRRLPLATLIALLVVLGPAYADHSATHGKTEAVQECAKIVAAQKEQVYRAQTLLMRVYVW